MSIDFYISAGTVVVETNAYGVYALSLNISEMELVVIEINHSGYLPFNDTQAIIPGDEHEIDFSFT